MSLPHALLTALSERPCSGSELARRFDRSIGYFWPATHQQIYRELSRMESKGWLACEAPVGTAGRKRLYRVLASGAEELRRWVAEPREPKAIRDELLVKVRAEAVLGGGGATETLVLRLARHRSRLANYREIEASSFATPDISREARLRKLILEAGVDLELLWIKLCEEALAVLSEKD